MYITIVSSSDGDWSGVYYDDKLRDEGHEVRHDELLDALVELGQPISGWCSKELSNEWFEEMGGSLPSSLKAIDPEDFIS